MLCAGLLLNHRIGTAGNSCAKNAENFQQTYRLGFALVVKPIRSTPDDFEAFNMSDDRAVLGSYAEWQMIKSRKVLVLKIEVPLEQAEDVLDKLGFPMPDTEIPVAICRIDALAASDYRAQQRRSGLSVVGKERYKAENAMKQARDRAGAYCRNPKFIAWANDTSDVLYVHDEKSAAEFIHDECGIPSRRNIATNEDAYQAFLRLEARYLEQTGQRAEAH